MIKIDYEQYPLPYQYFAESLPLRHYAHLESKAFEFTAVLERWFYLTSPKTAHYTWRSPHAYEGGMKWIAFNPTWILDCCVLLIVWLLSNLVQLATCNRIYGFTAAMHTIMLVNRRNRCLIVAQTAVGPCTDTEINVYDSRFIHTIHSIQFNIWLCCNLQIMVNLLTVCFSAATYDTEV